jgi:signal transduction histidine kinase
LIDLLRRFAEFRRAPLPWRLSFGASTTAVGVLVVLGLDDLLDDALVLAAFFPAVQIAAMLGGLAAAACSALLSAAIVHFWITPFPRLAAGFVLFFVSAALVGVAARAARSARASQAEAQRGDEAAAGAAPGADGRTFESAAAAVTHDLNQPLAAAVAYLHSARRLLSAEPAATRAAQVAETLDKAAAQLTRAGRLIAGLRDFLSHGPSRLAPLGLHALIHEAVSAGPCNPALDLRLDARCDIVLGDRAQIEQMLAAMLAGAKGAPDGGGRIATTSDAAAVTVEIASGAPRDAEPHGWRAEASIWRAIVETHRGAFRIESSADGGSAIAFSLPLASPATHVGG